MNMAENTQNTIEQAAEVVKTFVGEIPAGEVSQMLTNLYDKLGELVETHGETVYDGIMSIIQIHAGYSLLLALAFTLGFFWVGYKGWKSFGWLTANDEWDNVMRVPRSTLTFLKGCAGTLIGAAGFFPWVDDLLDLYYWLALVKPEWGLAYKVVVKALGL